LIDQGQIAAQDTFKELLKTNEYFKKTASHAWFLSSPVIQKKILITIN
jgi:hypothetical protein